MLQAIREKVKGWVAYTIIALLVVPFATVGVYNYVTGGSDPTVAEVNGDEITRRQLDYAVQQYQGQLREQLGDDYQRFLDTVDAGLLRRQQLERLVNETLVRQYIDAEGIHVSNAAVRREIQGIPAFRQDGRFSQEAYQRFLRGRGLSAGEFEARVRQGLRQQSVQGAIEQTAMTTPAELERVAALEFQERRFDVLRIDAEAVAGAVEISEDDIEAYYEANSERFERPQQVRIEYLSLTRDALAEAVSVSEEEVRERYESLRDSRYRNPETRTARHILIEVPDDAGEDAVAEGKERAIAARQRIEEGESFGDLAREVSDDGGSADSGGSLGTIFPGDLGEGPLEEAIFDAEEGVVSEPIRTEFGWHVVEVTEVRGGEVTPFEEAEESLRDEIAEARAESRFFEASTELANLAYENSDSLAPAADALGLDVQTSDWFSARAGDGIAGEAAIREAAFSDDVRADGYNTDVIDLDEDQAVVLRKADERPATTLPLAEVREQVQDAMRAERSAEMAGELARELEARLRDGDAAEAIAEEDDAVTLESSSWMQRRAEDVPQPVLRQVFGMPRPGSDEPSLARVNLGAGDIAVIALRGVRDGDLEDLDQGTRERLASQLRRLEAQSAWRGMLAALRADADVSIREDRIGGGS